MSSEIIAECSDYSGRHIRLDRNHELHIRRRHPEVLAYVPRVCEIVEKPDVVRVKYDTQGLQSHLYCKQGITAGVLERSFLIAAVRFEPAGVGVIKTVYASSRLPRGKDVLGRG